MVKVTHHVLRCVFTTSLQGRLSLAESVFTGSLRLVQGPLIKRSPMSTPWQYATVVADEQ